LRDLADQPPTYFKPAITDLDGVKKIGAEAKERGFTALKTNIFLHDEQPLHGYFAVPDRPGWGTEPIEEALRAHPPKSSGGLMSYRQKS
jgi:hypothetical protein